jgi:hypothetical protein
MKRVKYALGAAMFTPAVIGVAVPTAANAVALKGASTGTKAVSLRHSAATTSLKACGPVPTSDVNIVESPTSLWRIEDIWNYPTGNSWCVGTVRIYRYFINNNCINVTFNILYSGGIATGKATNVCGKAGSSRSIEHTFRQIYPGTGAAHSLAISIFSNYNRDEVVLNR